MSMRSPFTRATLAAILLLGAMSSASAQGVPDAPLIPTGPAVPGYNKKRLMIKLRTDVVRAMAAEQEGIKIVGTAGSDGVLVAETLDNMDVLEKKDQLAQHPAVESVELDWKVTVFSKTPNDEKYSSQWHLPKIQAPQAWDYSTGSTTVKVCHVDSGIRVDHPDLVQNVVKGWNFVPPGQVDGTPPPSASDPAYLNYNDTYGHGTHTAGILGAVGNNLRGVAGVNWALKLYVCRFIWNDGSGYVSDAMKCISLCAAEGAMITSNSWGGIGYSDFLKQEIQNAQRRGQLFVVASGNSGQDLDAAPLYPASYGLPNMISVASTGTSDDISSFSNTGARTVDIAAPGEAIFSTTFNGDYGLMWGTSMATPVVAGVAALLQAQAQAAGATLTSSQLVDFITKNGDTVPQLQGRLKTGMRVNAFKAAKAVDAYLRTLGPRRVPSPASPVPSTAAPRPSPSPVMRPSPAALLNATLSMQSLTGKMVCGTSALRGKPTRQSSLAGVGTTCGLGSTTAGSYSASRAVDGKCQGQWTSPIKGSCAMTDKQDYPWWQVDMGSSQKVMAVAITTRGDCSWQDLGGAKIFLGSRSFKGAQDALPTSSFILCNTVPATGVPRGQRSVFACAPPVGITAQFIAVFLPKRAARLTLCEVDVVTQDWLLKAAQSAQLGTRRL